jgi:alpha-tubulin suppressor-like RCC1 family protein
VLAWGSDSDGQLGRTGADSTVPVSVPMPHGDTIKAVSAGCGFGLAITTTGRVLAWGDNTYGELGDGGTASSPGPVAVKVPGRTKVSSVNAGCNQGFAVTTTGGVLAWGLNSTGQLGDHSTKQADKPVKIGLPHGIKVISVSSGLDHTLAVTSVHHALAWGFGTNGELGDGTIGSSDRPVSVRLPPRTTLRAVSAGYDYSLAVTTSGRALAWGLNDIGQLGDGTVVQRDLPVTVKLSANVIAVAAAQAGSQSFAIIR